MMPPKLPMCPRADSGRADNLGIEASERRPAVAMAQSRWQRRLIGFQSNSTGYTGINWPRPPYTQYPRSG
eukprot:scaffold52056_cov37-Tisochrysis_lutea.AAC.1